jgi:thymidine phosphorylase
VTDTPPATVDLIHLKRDGGTLSGDEVRWLIDAYTRGEIADEQMSALLMAIFFRGLAPDELREWTAAMIASGDRLDLSGVGRPTVDKHSTGGVGDKVSLILAPLVAACGAAVPQLSGRGLGHTGGTLDKLESIPGWRPSLTPAEMTTMLSTVGAVICAAGAGLAPADRKLYALRDVTGTVESIPLIASSIMSKKIAEGTSALVLDVKVGSGAFMTELDSARELAQTMVTLGTEQGVRTSALLTAMDVPLGRAVGNALEVEESLAVLRGAGPPDLVEVTVALAREMLALAGIDADPAAALADGRALAVYRAMIAGQGGDPDAELPRAAVTEMVPAPASGWLRRLDARAVGVAAWRLGAGRARKEDPVSAAAGILCHAKPGERVEAGQPLLELRADRDAVLAGAHAALAGAIEVGDEPPSASPLIIDRITGPQSLSFSVVGALCFSRFVASAQWIRWMGPLAFRVGWAGIESESSAINNVSAASKGLAARGNRFTIGPHGNEEGDRWRFAFPLMATVVWLIWSRSATGCGPTLSYGDGWCWPIRCHKRVNWAASSIRSLWRQAPVER